MDPYLIPLKAKYRLPGRTTHTHIHGEPSEGTRTYNAGRFKSKVSNSGAKQKAQQGVGHRRRSGWGFTNTENWQ